MENSSTLKAKRIEKGLYEATNSKGVTFSLLCWFSWYGSGSKEWQIYQCEAQKIINGENDNFWAGCEGSKKDALTWINK